MNKEWLLFLRSVPFFAKVRPFPSFFHFSFAFCWLLCSGLLLFQKHLTRFTRKKRKERRKKEEKKKKKRRKKEEKKKKIRRKKEEKKKKKRRKKEEKKKKKRRKKEEKKKNLFSLWLFLWNGNIEREGAPADRWIRVQEKQIGLSWIWPLRFKTSVKEKKLLETSFVISFLTKQNKTQITTKHPKWKSLVCSSLISAKPPIVSTMNRKSHLKTPKEERHSGGNQRKHRDQVPTISLKLEHCNTLEHTGHHIFQG